MITNTKNTKYLLLDFNQKLNHSSETAMEICFDNIKLEEAEGEKLLGVIIDSNLSWNLQIDYLMKKNLNSRICLLKRAKACLTFARRKMSHIALKMPILEYCCTVRGNCTADKSSENSVKCVQGLSFSIFISFHKNKVFTVTFGTKKNQSKRANIGCEIEKSCVWVRCLPV